MIYVVGGGSIASGKVSSRVNLTNAFSDSCAVYHALTMRPGVGRESQPDLLPLVCQRILDWTGWCVQVIGKAVLSGDVYRIDL